MRRDTMWALGLIGVVGAIGIYLMADSEPPAPTPAKTTEQPAALYGATCADVLMSARSQAPGRNAQETYDAIKPHVVAPGFLPRCIGSNPVPSGVLSICLATLRGEPIAAEVSSNPMDLDLERCVREHLMGVTYPSRDRLDITRAKFEIGE